MDLWSFEINNEVKIKTTDYDHFAYCLASSVIQRMQIHKVPVYYIYKNGELYNIIKGSEFDPLSKFQKEFSDAQLYYMIERKIGEQEGDLSDKFDIIYQIIEGIYKRTEEQLKEIDAIYKDVKNFSNNEE